VAGNNVSVISVSGDVIGCNSQTVRQARALQKTPRSSANTSIFSLPPRRAITRVLVP